MIVKSTTGCYPSLDYFPVWNNNKSVLFLLYNGDFHIFILLNILLNDTWSFLPSTNHINA